MYTMTESVSASLTADFSWVNITLENMYLRMRAISATFTPVYKQTPANEDADAYVGPPLVHNLIHCPVFREGLLLEHMAPHAGPEILVFRKVADLCAYWGQSNARSDRHRNRNYAQAVTLAQPHAVHVMSRTSSRFSDTRKAKGGQCK